MRKSFVFSLAAWALVGCTSLASAAGWGTLKGKFVLDGKAPAPAKLAITKDPAVCAAPGHVLVDESLVVDKDGGIADIIVALYLKPGAKKPELNPSFAEGIKKPVEIDNSKCRFEPRISVVFTGQELILKNSDPIGHNVKANLLLNPAFNDLIPGEAKITKKPLKVEEKLPAEASCSIHPWMRGYIVVREDPYVAVSAKDGTFEIKDVPAGDWTFRAWQERSGYVEEVKIGGKATKWEKGRFEVKIADKKDFDVGEIQVPLKEFPVK